MTGQELLLTALDQRYEKYRAERKRCKDEFSEQAVHELRVATRRMLALIELLRAVTSQPRLKDLRRAFKEQLDSLDELRDTQVMLAEISKTIESLPDLACLQKILRKREKRLLKAAERDVRGLKVNAIAASVKKVRTGLLEAAFSQDLTTRLLTTVDEAFLTVTQRYGLIDPTLLASVHHMRIAFKKFRYMVELIYLLLPGFPQKNLGEMHAYQSLMGDIQDLEVFLRALGKFAGKDKNFDPILVRAYYQRRLAETLKAYLENAQQFDRFWRPASDRLFPWEDTI
jgi:CHAD domain-containing protein